MHLLRLLPLSLQSVPRLNNCCILDDRYPEHDGRLPRARVERLVFQDDGKTISHLEITMLEPTDQYGYQDDFHGLELPEDTILTVPAEQVVLSAGTVGTSLILQRSEVNNPNVGKGFNGHTSFPVLAVFDQEIQANNGVTASVYIDDYADEGFILESMSANAAYISTLFPNSPTDYFKGKAVT